MLEKIKVSAFVGLMCAGLALIFMSPAQAGNPGDGAHSFDAREIAAKYFDQMDANGDEIVTEIEFEASPLVEIVSSFEALMPDENRKISKRIFIKNFVKAHPKPEVKV